MPPAPRPAEPADPSPARIAARATDAALVEAARRGDPSAVASIYDRHAAHLRRVLARVLGIDSELPDCLHETFSRAFESLGSLEDPARLEPWLTSIAVHTARGLIRRRQRARWLRFFAPEDLPEMEAVEAPDEVREAVKRTYAILEKMPVDERIALTLRMVEGMELTEAAAAASTSLATFKRRLARADERFRALAARDPVLRAWLDGAAEEGT